MKSDNLTSSELLCIPNMKLQCHFYHRPTINHSHTGLITFHRNKKKLIKIKHNSTNIIKLKKRRKKKNNSNE